MKEDKSAELLPGPAVVRGYVYRALNLLARAMEEQAKENGGSIGAAGIGDVLADFKRPDSTVLGAICDAAWEDCGAIFDSEGRAEDRKAPFQRLMVWPFSHLLPKRGGRDGEEGTISRRIIPGYMAAIEDMVGPMLFGRQLERSRELVRAARNTRGGAFRWEDVYEDRHSQGIVDDVLVTLAGEFGEFEEQRDWFIGLVNDAMPLPTNGSGHTIALDDDGFTAIMKALYANLSQQLVLPGGEARLLERHGATAVKQVIALLMELDES